VNQRPNSVVREIRTLRCVGVGTVLRRIPSTWRPNLAIGDGALGFWDALAQVYPKTETQRCWFHKMRNVLDKLPKSQQPQAKLQLKEIYNAPTREEALKAMDTFNSHYQLKYSKAVESLLSDKEALLRFYHYPAEHWVHLKTTNPIESLFSTVQHRARQSRGCFSRSSLLGCVFKLCLEAEKRWKPLCGKSRLPQVIQGNKFKDGLPVSVNDTQNTVVQEAA